MTSQGAKSAAQRELPRSFGRYDIISRLGVGGMAQVYLAMQRGPASVSRLVALKQLRAEVAADSQFLTMFADEARIALRLSHPNVVHTYEVVADSDAFFIAMELVQGQSLSALLRHIGRERMPLHEHIWILSQVLAGLHHAHTLTDFDGTPLKIVHRDVSPSNAIVTYEGEVKLLDFGIAKASVAKAATQVGVIKGKLGYASPEQCLGSPVDARSDVYAVGVMLWEAIAGRRRAVGDTALAQLQARVNDQELAIESVRPDVAPELADITRKALALSAEARFESALQMQQALETYLRTHAPDAGRDSLRALMLQHFEQEMTSFRRSLETYWRSLPERGNSEPPRQLEPAPPLVASLEPTSLSSSGTLPNGSLNRESENAFVFRSKPLRALPVVAALLALVIAGAFVVHRLSAEKPSAVAAAAPVITRATPSTLSSALGVPAPSTSAAPSPASGTQDEVRTTAKGTASRHPATRPTRPATATAAERASSPAPEGQAPPARAPEKATALEPGQDLRSKSNGQSTRPIDEKDPYSQ